MVGGEAKGRGTGGEQELYVGMVSNGSLTTVCSMLTLMPEVCMWVRGRLKGGVQDWYVGMGLGASLRGCAAASTHARGARVGGGSLYKGGEQKEGRMYAWGLF